MKNMKRKTSLEWAEFFSINFIDYKGFPSKKFFNEQSIDKLTFLLYASNCVISEPFEKTRRQVSNFKQKLINAK